MNFCMKLIFFQKFSFNFFAFIISKRKYCQRHSKICCLFFWGCVKNILTGSRLRSRQPKQRNIFFNYFTSLNHLTYFPFFFVFLTKSHYFHIYISIYLSNYLLIYSSATWTSPSLRPVWWPVLSGSAWRRWLPRCGWGRAGTDRSLTGSRHLNRENIVIYISNLKGL